MTHSYSAARVAERPQGPHKSPEAFRTISEVAEDLDVPAHVLRFWESRFAQVRPLKRGGGRRYYRPGDVALLKGIRRLLYSDGMTIKGAQKVMRERGVRFVASLGAPECEDSEVTHVLDGFGTGLDRSNGVQNADTDAVRKPLLTSEKRANLEAALTVLNDLRAELSTLAGGERAGEKLQREAV